VSRRSIIEEYVKKIATSPFVLRADILRSHGSVAPRARPGGTPNPAPLESPSASLHERPNELGRPSAGRPRFAPAAPIVTFRATQTRYRTTSGSCRAPRSRRPSDTARPSCRSSLTRACRAGNAGRVQGRTRPRASPEERGSLPSDTRGGAPVASHSGSLSRRRGTEAVSGSASHHSSGARFPAPEPTYVKPTGARQTL
jgi:hypothetical protein